jgi:hypothetical protein
MPVAVNEPGRCPRFFQGATAETPVIDTVSSSHHDGAVGGAPQPDGEGFVERLKQAGTQPKVVIVA